MSNRQLTRTLRPVGGWVVLVDRTRSARETPRTSSSAPAREPQADVKRRNEAVQLELDLGGAERCIGLAIRKGQEEGRIAKRGSLGPGRERDGGAVTISKIIGTESAKSVAHEAYTLADGVSADQFEKALTKAKSEKDLSRANIVRKVKGENDLEPSDSRRTSWN